MKEDFSELVEYLDGKFNKIDERFEKTATKEHLDRVEGTVNNLTIKVADLDVRMVQVEERLGKLEESVHALTTAIDKLAKAVDDLRIEYSTIAMKVDRHEKWFHQIAEKLGLKLEYD